MDNGWIIALEAPTPDALAVPVLKVFDGDGFLTRLHGSMFFNDLFGKSEIDVSVRFGFIDAPELDQPGGPEARDFLTRLIDGQEVLITILTKLDTGKSVDRYGRVLCVPYVHCNYVDYALKSPSGNWHRAHAFGQPFRVARNIELEMVLNGWAWVIERYGPDERYLQALEDARKNRRGIWAREDNVHPWEFKKQKGLMNRRSRRAARSGSSISCPEASCGGKLIKRSGRFGPFFGCSNYPTCKYSCSAAEEHQGDPADGPQKLL